MALFFAAEAQEPQPNSATTLKALQKKIQEMEETARFNAKYGDNLNPAQIEFCREQEAKEKRLAEKRRVHAEQAAISKQARTDRLAKVLQDRIKDGTLIAKVGDNRVKISQDLKVPCPDCGGKIDVSTLLLPYAEALLERTPALIAPWGKATMFWTFYGLPCIYVSIKCQSCKKKDMVLIFSTGW